MNLQDVLDANGINRDSYNTVERRTGLPFMKRKTDAARVRDKYFPAHAAALACLFALKDAGVPLTKAAAAVDGVFEGIWRTVGLIGEGQAPGWSMIHVVDFEDGSWGFAYGAPDATTLRHEAVGAYRSRVSVNAISVLKRIHTRVNETAEATA